MRKELDEQLCKDFPLTFRDRHASMMNTCMCWGFPEDGWYEIIKAAASKIEPRIQQLIDEGKESEDIRFTSSQLKEKFGTGRWSFTFSDPIIDAATDEFEEASAHTCEECGKEGKLRGKSWLYTACEECHENRLQDRARDYLLYEVKQELNKKGHPDAVAVLEEWQAAQEKKKKAKEDVKND